MWNWLGNNPVDKNGRLNEKKDWPGCHTIYGLVHSDLMHRLPRWGHFLSSSCFACQVAPSNGSNLDCDKCPVLWKPANMCQSKESVFTQWDYSVDPKERSRLAYDIAKRWK
jgi:hypothetical protein